ncbi:MAG: hypothetical protein FJ098_16515 [Deltaproteobacteria bacterium]|nr:hypothetical protein [Deltaproteobacteria bacterium]
MIRVAGKELRVSAVDGPPGTSLLVSLSSADVILSRDHPAEMSTENIYCGRVKAVFPAREGALVLLDAGFDLYAQVSSEALQRLPVREGGELHYILRDGALRVHEEPLQGQVIAPFNSDEPRTPPQ